jgi:hypothetical protein
MRMKSKRACIVRIPYEEIVDALIASGKCSRDVRDILRDGTVIDIDRSSRNGLFGYAEILIENPHSSLTPPGGCFEVVDLDYERRER